MFRTVTFLYGVFQVLALRGAEEVDSLIEDQSVDDAPVKPSKSQLGTSLTVLSAEGLDSSESPEADPLKTALLDQESWQPLELPKCSKGKLQLESGTYKVTDRLDIPEPCNVSSNGATLLLSAPILFWKTARFEGKLFVNGSGSLEGPCFSFEEDAFIQSAAEMHFADCHNVAKDDDGAKGGAIHVRGNLSVTGNLSIHNSSAKFGGGIYVHDNFEHLGGEVKISESLAKDHGGGIYVHDNFKHLGGEVKISESSANYGGGIYVHDNFMHLGGEVKISESLAEYDGGGICVFYNFMNSGGSLSVTNSSAKRNGGGLYVRAASGNAVFANTTASFSQCHAQLEGGGIKTPSNLSLTDASLTFKLATAGDRGAALRASHLEQIGGDMRIYDSSASGEVISLAAWVIDGGIFHIQDCKADSFLMAAHEGARLHATEFVVVNSSAAGMLVSSGEVTMSKGVFIFNQASSPQLRANVVKVTHLSVTGSEALLSWASGSKAAESTVHDMDCDDAFGGYNLSDGIGCTKCDPGSVFVKNITEKTIANRSVVQHCVPCPDGARLCNGTAIEMLPGMMVEQQNISRGFHCPNPLACPGAIISGNTNTSTQMCDEGYEDVGCAKCTNDWARSNSNVFICVRCAQDIWWKVKDAVLFFTSDAVIFIISAVGVVNAGRQNKNSTVYLNQLMAFAAVTAPALLAVKNTTTFVSFEHQLKSLWQLITFVSTPVQVGDAGESANTVSTECILRYVGMEPSLASSHFLSSVVYTVLTLSLAAKSGMSVAVVVGINCFLPKFCAAFGAYLICFTMEPAPLGEMHCLVGNNWLGATIRAFAFLAIMLCFIVGPGSWIIMTRDKSLSDKPQVLFLTRSYRKGFETWEVERLVRRMLLKIIGATLPTSVNPSAQMVFVSFVLVASLFFYSKQAPYAKDEWNQIEQRLLVTALFIVILTTLCLANARHWGHSDGAQVVMILAIIGIVGVAGFVQSFLLIRELILERLPQPVNTPEPMEPIEPTEGEDGEVSKG